MGLSLNICCDWFTFVVHLYLRYSDSKQNERIIVVKSSLDVLIIVVDTQYFIDIVVTVATFHLRIGHKENIPTRQISVIVIAVIRKFFLRKWYLELTF